MKTFQDYFRKKLIEEEQKYVKKFQPFCFRCAKIDFEDKVEKKIKEMERKLGYIDWGNKELTRIDIDFKNYGPQRFEQIDIKEVREDKLLDGIRQPGILTGYNIIYRCKVRGCGRTVNIPKEKYDKLKESK